MKWPPQRHMAVTDVKAIDEEWGMVWFSEGGFADPPLLIHQVCLTGQATSKYIISQYHDWWKTMSIPDRGGQVYRWRV